MIAPYYQRDGITIYHADARNILPHFSDQSFDCMFCDPPYGHANGKKDLTRALSDGGLTRKQATIANDTPDKMRRLLDSLLREAARILKSDCCCCCCCCCGGGPRPTFAWLAERMDRDGLAFFHSTIWDKVNPGLGWKYRRQHEMIFVAHRRGGRLSWRDGEPAVSNIQRQSKPRTYHHPNEKPLRLVYGFVRRHCPAGGRVIDPCMGSGTTLVAARMLGVEAVGIDTVKKNCDRAIKRLSQTIEGTTP